MDGAFDLRDFGIARLFFGWLNWKKTREIISKWLCISKRSNYSVSQMPWNYWFLKSALKNFVYNCKLIPIQNVSLMCEKISSSNFTIYYRILDKHKKFSILAIYVRMIARMFCSFGMTRFETLYIYQKEGSYWCTISSPFFGISSASWMTNQVKWIWMELH